ncbi:HEAT repeat domain-containing protein [Microcystis aeruginosa CS-567/02]|nr:HEAT repeat domain-containing protein [Microcystis aeruginosa]MDB9412051.1 HEAT repeat domain-containing protein [Microcystis aeruginosa CS-567/02]
MVNWQPYFDSIRERYQECWKSYTITDVEGKFSPSHRFPLLLDLRVETVAERKEEREEKTERFDILTGLRTYSLEANSILTGLWKYSLDTSAHVLLQGKPGSGKSTALVRLLLEEGSRRDENRIPVLLELRAYKTSVVDMIQGFCRSHDMILENGEIEDLLNKRRFFLLIDGINELPSDEAANEVIQFRKTYPRVPMVFTTRELGLRGNLGIEKQLTMQPLTEKQMREFVRGYLGDEGLLQQLRDERLEKLGETPLLLWMLCSIYARCGQVPENLGETFREFNRVYDDQLKADVTTRAGSKDLWADSLQYLAFQMTIRKDEPVIGVGEAEGIIGDFLRENGENDSLSRRRGWLGDLIRFHLLQKRNEDSIEFHHQLIQEYYAAEYLLKQLEKLSDRDLQWRYLNYLKWTEPIALMLGLLKDEKQALRVVKLALAVDLGLGARLAGEVNPSWQEETVQWVAELPISMLYRVYLLGKTGSERAVEALIAALGDERKDVRSEAVWTLQNIGSKRAVEALIAALGDEREDVRSEAVKALGKIDSERAVEGLIAALGHEDGSLGCFAAWALGEIGSERAVEALIAALENERIGTTAAWALGNIGSERAVEALIAALKVKDEDLRYSAVLSLAPIGSERAVEPLIAALGDENRRVRCLAAWGLGNIGSERVVEPLIAALNDGDSEVRTFAADSLGAIGSERAVEPLVTALGDEDEGVRYSAARALGEIGSERAVDALITALGDEDGDVHGWAARALGEIGSERAVEPLIAALSDEDASVRYGAVRALGAIGSERAVKPLIAALGDGDMCVRYGVAVALRRVDSERAVEPLITALEYAPKYVYPEAVRALGEIGSERAVEALITAFKYISWQWPLPEAVMEAFVKIGPERTVEPLIAALGDENRRVRYEVAWALGNIGSERAVEPLITALGDEDEDVRYRAAEALGKIGLERAVELLITALGDEDRYVRNSAAEALGKIGSERAVEPLITALENKWIGTTAVEALGKIGSERAIFSLVKNLKNPDFPYPVETIKALEAIQNKYQHYALEPIFLPTGSLIPDAKITNYLLKLRPKDDKSKYLARAGFTLANPDALKSALIQLIQTNPAIEDLINEYGTFYRVEGELIGSNQVRLSVVTIWLKRNLDHQFQFITLKPRKEQ